MHKRARLLAWLEKLTKEGGLRLSKVSQFLVPAAPYSSLFISFLVHQSRFVEGVTTGVAHGGSRDGSGQCKSSWANRK